MNFHFSPEKLFLVLPQTQQSRLFLRPLCWLYYITGLLLGRALTSHFPGQLALNIRFLSTSQMSTYWVLGHCLECLVVSLYSGLDDN